MYYSSIQNNTFSKRDWCDRYISNEHILWQKSQTLTEWGGRSPQNNTGAPKNNIGKSVSLFLYSYDCNSIASYLYVHVAMFLES